MLGFISESAQDFKETATVGGFTSGSNANSFDQIFKEACDHMIAQNINPMLDITEMVKNKAVMSVFKDELLNELYRECAEMKQDPNTEYGTHALLYEEVSDLFDNCVDDLYKESTRVGQLLPIKAVDLPILIKQYLKLATKDIMQTEITKTPVVKKHIEQTWIYSNNDPSKRWKYPQCFFTDEFKEIFDEGKGHQIKDTPVTLPQYNYDIVKNLSDGVSGKDKITIDLKIVKVIASVPSDAGTPDGATESVEVTLKTPMRIDLSSNSWLGGQIKQTVKNAAGQDVEIDDIVMGSIDMRTSTTSIASCTGKITAVVFGGYLSNERNERHVNFDYTREEREFKIEDGTRVDVPYSLEELEDAKALLSMDLYQRTYNNLGDFLLQMEDSKILEWLDEQYELYKGIEVNPLDWDGFISETQFDCDSTSITTALPTEYIKEMLKFKIDCFITSIADKAKLEDMTFVIYGNPQLIHFLDPSVNWVTRPGSTRNGVKLDYGYGVMTSGDVKVQVVSTKKVNLKYDEDNKLYKGLRLIPFPISNEQFTFKHYKYTSHILTAQNSAYRAPDLPGGSYTNLVGVSRYTNAAIQGIQGEIDFANMEQYLV